MTDPGSSTVGRRRSPRVRIAELSAALASNPTAPDPDRHPVSLVNINESGVALLARPRLGEVGETFGIRLLAHREGTAARCLCAIRYSLGGEHGPDESPFWLHGAEFVSLDEAARHFLKTFVRPHLAAYRAPA